MEYEISAEGYKVAIFLSGRFDFQTGGIVRKIQAQLFEMDCVTSIDFDLFQVSYIDSTAIGMLLYLRSKIGEKFKIRVGLINAQGITKRVIEEMQLHRLFNVS